MLEESQAYRTAGHVEGIIFDIKRFAIHDGTGIRTTIFFKGCPLRCWWCHNPESQQQMPEQVPGRGTVGRRVTAAEVINEIEKDNVFYDESGGGVTFSGGEPLMQPRFLAALLDRCRQMAIHTILDTSGHAPRHLFDSLVDQVDLFLYDLKLIDEAQHIKYTGISNYWVRENLRALARKGKPVIVRFPVIPGITDSERNITGIGEFVRTLESVREIHLLPHHPTAREKYRRFNREETHAARIPPPTPGKVAEIKKRFEHLGFTVKIGG